MRKMTQTTFGEKLPTEIWTEVFLKARKTRIIEGGYKETRFTPTDVPMTISQVCKRFRQITINTPPLWSTIVVNLSPNHPDPPAIFRMAKLWLERSKNAPLSVFMYEIKDWFLEDDAHEVACLRTLLSHSGRWKEAALHWEDTYQNFWVRLSEIAPSAPLLESVCLGGSVGGRHREIICVPSRIWTNSPCLRKLTVGIAIQTYLNDNEYEDWRPVRESLRYLTWTTASGIPYSQLTHLRFGTQDDQIISPNEVLTIFCSASNLVCCFIGQIGGIGDTPMRPTLPPIELPHLRHLCLAGTRRGADSNYYKISIFQLLDYITAASLTSLTLVWERSKNPEWKFTPFENFVLRSSCLLKELNIISTALEGHQVLACLDLTSTSLRRVHFDELVQDNHFITVLIDRLTRWDSSMGEYALCPALEQISLKPDDWYFSVGDSRLQLFPFLTQLLGNRLSPPNGGFKIFKNLLIPSFANKYVPPELRKLCEDPTNLDIVFNDKLLTPDTLWRRLAYE